MSDFTFFNISLISVNVNCTFYSYFRVVTTLEELRPDIRALIEPFHNPDPRASNDKLNNIQRAFVKYCVRKAVDVGDSITYALVTQTISDGAEYGIWMENYQPEDCTDFAKYILNRMKNERKSLRRSEVLHTQQEMLSTFLGDTMSHKGAHGNLD